jgi:serine/threonine-protein kinase
MSDEAAQAAALPGGVSAGSRVAGYRIEEQIGRGGMAVVFRAYDERLERQVALKVLAPALATDESFRRRFIRESRSAAAVDHPHIIPVFDAGEADGVLFLAMRYVPAGDAGSLIRQSGPLPPARAAAIITAVASALDAAHAAGLVHRDVKPGNMLIDARPGQADHVYLSDFGLTKGAMSSALTGTAHFIGTLDYCAPEQIQGGTVDRRTDEYALACAAFELLSGQPPFPREDGMAVLYAQLSAAPPSLAARRPGLPPGVDDVLQQAMAKAPDDRYPSCGRFAAALGGALGYQPPGSSDELSLTLDHPATEVARIRSRDAGDFRPTQDAEPQPATPAAPADPRSSGHAGLRRGRGILAVASIAVLAAGGAFAAVFLGGNTGNTSGHAASLGTAHSAGSPAKPTLRPGSSPATGSASHSDAPVRTAGTYMIVRTLTDPGATRQVDSVTFSGDGKTLVTGDMNGNAYVWSTASGRQSATLRGRSGVKVFSSAISPDGTLAATGGANGTAYLWQTAGGRMIGTAADPGGSAVNMVAFSPDGKILATADKNGNTYLWAVSAADHSVTLTATLTDPAGAGVWSLAFSPDGRTLATGDFAGDTQLWNVTGSANPTQTFAGPGGQYVTAIAFSPDGRTLATGNYNGSTYLWNIARGTHTVIPAPATVWGVAISQSDVLAIGDDNGSTYLWNLRTGNASVTLTDPASGSHGVGALAFSPGGQTLATGDTNGSTYLWRIG